MKFSTKYEAIVYCSTRLNLNDVFYRNKFKIKYEHFLEEISKERYNLVKDKSLNITASTCSKYMKLLFPNRTTTEKPCTYILGLFKLKFCPSCKLVYSYEYYFKNKSTLNGISAQCKTCTTNCWNEWYASNKHIHIARVAEYRARLTLAMPNWANKDKIVGIYSLRKQGEHVDHIIPLCNDCVCGLHVHNNLRCVSSTVNLEKNNKFNSNDFKEIQLDQY